MDQHLQAITAKRVERTMASLEKNRMHAVYAETRREAVQLVAGMIPEGATVGFGGSMTLAESGVMDMLRGGSFHLLDRDVPGLTPEQIKGIYRACFSSDVFLCSSNAITENGELYNVDGNSNRVAAMLYGPDRVIVVAGINKLVSDLAEADHRLRTVAAPANATRLSCPTPCVKTGYCGHCRSESRICCNAVTMGFQRHPGRMTVVLVGESLGY